MDELLETKKELNAKLKESPEWEARKECRKAYIESAEYQAFIEADNKYKSLPEYVMARDVAAQIKELKSMDS